MVVDEGKLKEFVRKVVNEWGAAEGALVTFVGDRLGLFKAMTGAGGALAPEELAKKTGTHPRIINVLDVGSGIGGPSRYLALSASLLLLIGALGLETIGLRPVAAQETSSSPSSPPVTLQTNNESVTVLVNWSPQEIQPGQEVQFMLDFQHPFSGESLPHVNYNFEIMDEQGNIVESMTDLHTHAGNDVQTVTFNDTGSFRLIATIIGTGLEPPFDTTRSGTAESAIMVVPEFPIAPVILAAATGLGIALARMRMKRRGCGRRGIYLPTFFIIALCYSPMAEKNGRCCYECSIALLQSARHVARRQKSIKHS